MIQSNLNFLNVFQNLQKREKKLGKKIFFLYCQGPGPDPLLVFGSAPDSDRDPLKRNNGSETLVNFISNCISVQFSLSFYFSFSSSAISTLISLKFYIFTDSVIVFVTILI